MLSLHIRDSYSLHGQVDAENADNPGGHVIGQLYRHIDLCMIFVITNKVKVSQGDDEGHIWWYEVLQEGDIKGIRKKDFDLAVALGKIERVK